MIAGQVGWSWKGSGIHPNSYWGFAFPFLL